MKFAKPKVKLRRRKDPPLPKRRAWVASQAIQTLGRQVLLRTNSSTFGEVMHSMFRSFAAPGADARKPEEVLSVVVAEESNPEEPHRFYRGRKLIRETHQYWKLMRLLEWQLDRFLVRSVEDYLLLHAGSVSIGGAGVLIPGSSRAGKSSLTMALLLRGGGYFSDELSAISMASNELVAFPKALSCRDINMFPEVGEGAWFGPVSERELTEREPDGWIPVWFSHADDIRPGSVGAPTPITHVFFPERGDGDAPRAERMTRSEGMRKILRHSLNFPRAGEPAFRQAAQTAAGAQCYRLIGNGLAATTDLVLDVIARQEA